METLYEFGYVGNLEFYVRQNSHHTTKYERKEDECIFGFDEKNDLKYIYFVYNRSSWCDNIPDPDESASDSDFSYIFISFFQSNVQFINDGFYSTQEDTISVCESIKEIIHLFKDGILSSRKTRTLYTNSYTKEHIKQMCDEDTIVSRDISLLLSKIPHCKLKVQDNKVIVLSHP
jgi:hypothetical protein